MGPMLLMGATRSVADGWHRIDGKTQVRISDGEPDLVQSEAENLDAVLDDVQEWWGAPLEIGRWTNLEDQKCEAHLQPAEAEE
jgi:hypothetical protein